MNAKRILAVAAMAALTCLLPNLAQAASAPARRILEVDRIVAVVNEEVITRYDLAEQMKLAIDSLRRHQRHSALLGEAVPADDSPAPAGVDPETLRALQDVAHTLGPRELEVIILCRVDGLTHPECAATLSCGARS